MVTFDRHTLHALQTRLLDWFDANKRPLPWRANRDAYRVWVSEVMLQQTTVAAVVPFFERFVATLPTIRALAEADEQQVLKLWEGLGYYRRARHLHAAARQLVSDHGDGVPDDPEVWSTLPGVGRYILGAVLSQAFDRKLPIVEANSLRVLARLFGYRGDPRTGVGKEWVWSAAETVLPAKRPGDFNQALMELGALICTPTSPACDCCPLGRYCTARREGLQNEIPPKKTTPVVTSINEVGVVIRKGKRVLLCQRSPDAKRWQSMWEAPHGEYTRGEGITSASIRIARELTGFEAEPSTGLITIRHGVTRFAITMVCLEAEFTGGSFAPGFYMNARWLLPSELADYPVSSPQRKLMTELTKSKRQKRLF